MQKIQIQTTQNVTVEYEIAGVGRRIAAELIDIVTLAGYVIAFTIILSEVFNSGSSFASIFIILWLPVIFYDLLCETFMDGQSFGKKAMNIKVIKLDGTQPRFTNYLLRWVLKIVDVLICYGVIAIVTILINGKGQRLGDLAANTTVVRIRQNTKLDDTILTELTDNYQVVFPQAANLTDKDAGIIKEVIDRVDEFEDDETNEKLLQKTTEVIMQKLGITTDLTPYTFLNTILRDYNYTNGNSKS